MQHFLNQQHKKPDRERQTDRQTDGQTEIQIDTIDCLTRFYTCMLGKNVHVYCLTVHYLEVCV